MTLPDRFAHAPQNPRPGDTVGGVFVNPELAGQEVEIALVADGDPHATIVAQCDENGVATFSFTCPQAATMLLQHPTSADHGIVIGL